MDTEVLFNFLEATQSEALVKLEKLYKDKTRQTILNYKIFKLYRICFLLKHIYSRGEMPLISLKRLEK